MTFLRVPRTQGLFAATALVLASGAGTHCSSSSGGGGGAIVSAFPVGAIGLCTALLSDKVGGGGGVGGDQSFTLSQSENGGVVTVKLPSGSHSIFDGTLTFQVATATTALAVAGQSFGVYDLSSSGRSLPVRNVPLVGGSLVLIDNHLVLSLAGAGGATEAVADCLLPYAGCGVSPAAPSADLPSGTYDHCQTQGVDSITSVALTRTAGTVKAVFSPGLDGSVGQTSSVDLNVVADGVATLATSATAACGVKADDAVLTVNGDVLTVAIAKGVLDETITCVASGSTATLPAPAAGDVTPPGASASVDTTQLGKSVTACSACTSGEMCVGTTFMGDLCMTAGKNDSCPSGTHYDSGAQCCAADASTSYACWPMPAGCDGKPTCDCAADVVLLTCQDYPAGCTEMTGGITCTENSP